jgi:hypothetical protein
VTKNKSKKYFASNEYYMKRISISINKILLENFHAYSFSYPMIALANNSTIHWLKQKSCAL